MSSTSTRLGSLPQAHRPRDRSQHHSANDSNDANEHDLREHGSWDVSNEIVMPEGSVQQALLPTTRKRQIVVLISAFCTVFQTIGKLVDTAIEACFNHIAGINQAYGVFQNYYVSTAGSPDSILPPSQASNKALVAFIGTLAAGLTWGGSIFVNPLMARTKDLRWLTLAGVLLMSLGYGLAGFSTRVSRALRSGFNDNSHVLTGMQFCVDLAPPPYSRVSLRHWYLPPVFPYPEHRS